MFSKHNDKDRLHFIFIGILCTGFVCVVIALCIQLSKSAEVEEIAVDELLQQYWQEHALDRVALDNAETEAFMNAKVDHLEQHAALDEAMNEQVTATNEVEIPEVSVEQSVEPITEAATHDGKIDINRATAEQLQQLKGIGPSKAKAIVDDREQKGRFKSIADIKRVKGIGEKLYAGIQESIVANP